MKDWRYCRQRVEAWRSEARIQIASAGRFSGKSETYTHKFIKFTMRKPWDGAENAKYSYCFPTQKQARRNIWDKLKAGYRKTGAVRKINESEMKIELAFRDFSATVYVDGLDKPHRIEGSHYHGICVDEMSDTKPNAVKLSILPALNAHQGWLWMLGVPKRIGVGAGFYKDLCIGELAKTLFSAEKTSVGYFHWTAEDIYTDDELFALRQLLSEKDYNEQALAKWETASGLVYYSFSSRENVLPQVQYNPEKPLLIGSDFNVSPMSWVVAQEGEEGEVFVLDELSILNTNTPETLDILWRKWGHHSAGFIFYGDAAGRSRSTTASVSDYIIIHNDHRFGEARGKVDIRYPTHNPAVLDRVACVNAMLRNADGRCKIFISKSCTELIKDLENLAFKEGTREIDKSDPMRTHMSDALGYLIYARCPLKPDRIAIKREIRTRIHEE